MNILVIDGQGGRLGSQLVQAAVARFPQARICAVGTNAMATAAMIKAGAHQAATGENPAIVACRTADVIVGPIGIVSAAALYGEVPPAMAVAVGQSRAARVLIPINKCDTQVAGVADQPLAAMIADALRRIAEILQV